MLTRRNWQVEVVVALFAGLFVLLVGLVSVFALVTHSMGFANHPDALFWRLFTGLLALQVPALGLTHGFLHLHDRSWRQGFGLAWSTDACKWGIAIAGVSVLVGYPIEYVTFKVLRHFGEAPEPQVAVQFLTTAPIWQRAAIGFLAVIPAAAAEEILFRGILFPLGRDFGYPRLALVGTSLLFGLVHFHPPSFIPLTLLGAGLAWGYQRTGNLLTCIVGHAAYNTVGLTVAVSGLASKL